MDWLNYHHLRYFYVVAKQGSLAAAASQLRISPPAISEQIRELEAALGERLFRREGRTNKLTDAGQVVFGFAEEIFALGHELASALKQRPGLRTLRVQVGIVDSFPKLLANEILRPLFSLSQAVHVICHEGKLEDLLQQLAVHRLDIVLADEPASSSVKFQCANHLLGESDTTFCADRRLAAQLKGTFPKALQDAPAFLPAGNTPFRRALEAWFRANHIQPRVVAEFEDLALMKVMAGEGRGFIAVPTVAAREAIGRYGFREIGRAKRCTIQFHAVTAERRIVHPAVPLLTSKARMDLF
jgi:LysR family transcriptional regulator, transcriptional activator of nhaA